MSIFPFVSGVFSDRDISIVENNKEESIYLYEYEEVAWDFVTDTPMLEANNFKIVRGKEAIKVWAYKAILTNRYEHEIYSWDYGSELRNLIGKPYTRQLIESEGKRYIREALLINPYIKAVTFDDYNFDVDTLKMSLTLDTIYGEVKINV